MYIKNQIGKDKLAEELGINLKWDIDRIQASEEEFSYFHWFHISDSEHVEWSVPLIKKFHDRLVWSRLVQNKSVPWSLDFCKEIRKYIQWTEFSKNFIFYNEYSSECLNSFLNEFSSEINWSGLSSNQKFNWNLVCSGGSYTSLPLVDFKEFWSYKDFYKNPSFWKYQDRILQEIPEKIDWNKLSKTPNIKWTPQMIRAHQKEIDWHSLCYRGKINWTKDLLDEFKNKVDWSLIVAYGSVNFSLELVTHFEEKWNEILKPSNATLWSKLSSKISNEIELIEKYREKWTWSKLLTNPNITWTKKLTETFSDEISQIVNESHYGFYPFHRLLEQNKNIDFSITTLEKCAKYWKRAVFIGSTKSDGFYTSGPWFYYSTNNKICPAIIRRFGKYLNVSDIINNPNLNWNISLIKAIINIEIPEKSKNRREGYEADFIFEQDFLDYEIGFTVNKENIINEMMKQPHIKNAILLEKLNSLKV